jgi:hypothetical protein
MKGYLTILCTVLVVAIAMGFWSNTLADVPAVTGENCPYSCISEGARGPERPKPLVTVQSDDPQTVLLSIGTLLQREHFLLKKFDKDAGEIWAEKHYGERGVNRVFIWLERGLYGRRSIHIHFSSSRLEPVLGRSEGLSPMALNENEENRELGPLKDALIRLGLSSSRRAL